MLTDIHPCLHACLCVIRQYKCVSVQGRATEARVCWCMLQGEHMLVLTVGQGVEVGGGQLACVGSGVYSC